jgi:hypothetical protein
MPYILLIENVLGTPVKIKEVPMAIWISLITLVVVIATFLAMTTDFFKHRVPIKAGFLYDGTCRDKLEVATGDPAKRIPFRFYNSQATSISNLVFDIRFLTPITLSATGQAVTIFEDHTVKGRDKDKGYYQIVYYNMVLLGHDNLEPDPAVEIKTNDISPGRYTVQISIDTTDGRYKKLTKNLTLIVK